LKRISTEMVVLIISITIAAILISITVIVLNPLSRISNTTSVDPSKILVIQKAVFFVSFSPDGSRMNISLLLNVKNIANRPVYIMKIEVPDLNWVMLLKDESLEPGVSQETLIPVVEDMPYTAVWERGTEHEVVVYFRVEGLTEELSVSVKAVVL